MYLRACGRAAQAALGGGVDLVDVAGSISAASVEQSRGIDQVGSAVTQLDQVTQQNAALVEEAAAAAEGMKHQALKLAQTVAVFKFDESPQHAGG